MPSTAAFGPGDIVAAPFPFSDLHRAKPRPLLVVSSRRHNAGDDVVVCAITSNLADARYSVLLPAGDVLDGSLHRDSRVKAAKIATLDRSLLTKKVGRVKPAIMEQVRRELRSALGL